MMKKKLTPLEFRVLEKRAHRISVALKKLFPKAKIFLKYSSNWELMVAVQLSARCTDKKVNEVTEKLFEKYKALSDYLKVGQQEFERDIKPTGFYRNKAKNILKAAKFVSENYGGKIPKTMEKMIAIPGIGRKSANVILGNAYGVVEGIAVDTHVGRLARIFGFTDENNPEKVEKDLMNLFPQDEWFILTYRLIDYGRKYCSARPHNHTVCPLAKL